ncbi:MAG: hypothetical protein H0X04_06220 [Chthoniobacterales bacterium]|nr:hypothetical protein [Chthoniobacterales bacterium]
MRVRLAFLLAAVLISFAGCEKRQQQTPSDRTTSPLPGVDACQLLSPAEVRALLGEELTNAAPSRSSDGALDVAQCHVQVPTFINSLIISVTRRAAGANGRDPREFWREKIERGEEAEAEGEREGEHERRPDAVEGLGEDAVWWRSPVGGALYVLKGDCFLTVSVGTTTEPDKRKERAIAVAHAIVPKL